MSENIDIITRKENIVAIADAVRVKNGTTAEMTLGEIVSSISEINTGLDTSDATADSSEIFAGETAYSANGKVTGTFTIDSELTEQTDLISQISTLVATKANPQGGTDTSDATATASDILSGKTAYAKGKKITGTMQASENLDAVLAEQAALITELETALEGKASGGGGAMVEMCTGEITIDVPSGESFTVYSVNSSLQTITTTISAMGGTFTAAKGTIVAIKPWSSMGSISGGCTQCFGAYAGAAFIVSDDFTLTYG